MATTTKKPRFVTDMGILYRVSPSKWGKLCKARADGKHVDVSDFGTYIGGCDNVTDWSREDFAMELAA